MKLINKTILILALISSAPAMAAKSLSFGDVEAHGVSVLQVFINANEPSVRCLCDRFSVLIADNREQIGSPYISKVSITAEGPDSTDVVELDSLNLIFRSFSSPVYSDQVIFTGPRKDKEYTVVALKQRCMNPTQDECKKMDVAAKGKFTASELSALEATTPDELLGTP